MITAKYLQDVTDTLFDVSGIDRLNDVSAFPEFDSELVAPVLEEAGKLARDILAPLNQIGDREGAKLTDDGVQSACGFKEAYAAFRDGGWMGLAFPEEYGGQGLPQTLAIAVMELIQAANMSFSLCPMLSFGAIEALLEHGSEDQKSTYLPKLVSGEWTGTMNLTEPQAGSDVGALKTKAIPNGDGSYAITGQKIYITWGDHDLTENIIHLVLARLPDAPEGSRGISLFLCPKYLLDASGNPAERNGARCIGLEHKLGIHGSPTCVMEFDGATGWMIGEPNRGLAAMFTMMNSARLQVGIQGVAQSGAAYEVARAFAEERKQGKRVGETTPAAIIRHADVQNMLLTMRAKTMAARAICYECAGAGDDFRAAADDEARRLAKWREDVLTPIAKAWSTDLGVEIASIGVQVHGGMGFMGDTLAAQFYRDARIAPIYEGTNGIQAADLVTRKVNLSDGGAIKALLDEFTGIASACREADSSRLADVSHRIMRAVETTEQATDWILSTGRDAPDVVLFGATAYLDLFGRLAGLAYLAKGSMSGHSDFVDLAYVFAEHELACPGALMARIRLGEGVAYDRRAELIA